MCSFTGSGMDIIQVDSLRNALAPDNAPRIADHRTVGRNGFQHDRARANLAVISDGERTQYLCARADDHVVADGRMTLADILACTAEGYTLIERHVVANDGRFADDYAVAMVDKEPLPDACAGMNLDPRDMAAVL